MKYLFTSLLIVSLAFSAKAQFKFGIQAGPNLSSIAALDKTTDEKTDKSPRFSFQIGVLAAYELSPKFTVDLGVNYSKQGTEWHDAEQNTIKLNYLKLPIMFNYPFALGTGQMKVGTGFYYAWALSGKRISNGVEEDLVFDSSPYSIFDKSDLGINFRSTYELANGINFALDYQLGLKNIASEQFKDTFGFKNRVVSLSLGYMIKTGKAKQ